MAFGGEARLRFRDQGEGAYSGLSLVDSATVLVPPAEPHPSPATGLRDMRLHEAVGIQADRRPGACAIVFEGDEFSYGWLQGRVEQHAAQLIARGVQPGDVVGLYMHRSPEMVAAMLAILKAGAAYLPLDPNFPQDRLEMILADAGAAAVLTEAALEGGLNLGGTPHLRCEDVPPLHAVALHRPAVGEADLAYVLYTSGSTGRPKGVEISHGAVMNLLAAFLLRPGFTERDVMLAATTTAFDISVLELFLPLVVGGRMVLASSPASKDPHALAALIDESGCTFAQGTPSKWRYLVEAGWKGHAGLILICGGEALTRELADRLLVRSDALWNVYGPTETTVWSTMAQVRPGKGSVPIGWAIDETTLHVLDEKASEVPDGDVGELYIGGSGLARGYRGRPELTLERFVSRGGERLYRTGDLVRRAPDGALECMGRTDHQVKIRGFRIELGDVEAALCQCEALSWAAATAWTDADGEKTLVAYVTLREGASPDPAALRRTLSARLPDYMIPSRFVRMDALPMTPNGKIDRKALPPPDQAPCLGNSASDAPVGATQIRLAEIWCGVLGLPSVSAGDNFFDLGGYSLLTLTLLRRIEAAFGRCLSMADLFGCADLRAMAARLEDGAPPVSSRGILVQPLGDRPPLIWFDVGPQLRGLASTLAPDQPFIGLNLEAEEEQDLSTCARLQLAQVARRMVTALRSIQPHGPYYLGGWCRWGVVAYAAAHRLIEEGEPVALLVLLDATNRKSPHQALKRAKRLARRSVGLPVRGGSTAVEATSFGEKVLHSANRYRPPSYQGEVLLLRAEGAERDWDGASGWRDVVKGVLKVVDVSGDHVGMLKPPHVERLGLALKSELERVQQG